MASSTSPGVTLNTEEYTEPSREYLESFEDALGDDGMGDEASVGHTAEDGSSRGRSRSNPVSKRRATRKEYWVGFTEFYDDNKLLKAKCNHCGNIYACDSNKNGTKNVRNHFYKCEKNPANKGNRTSLTLPNMDDRLKNANWSFDEKHIREKVVEMLVRDEMPFRAVEKDGLREAFFAACPSFPMPSRTTITRDFFKLFVKEREKMKEYLRKSSQSVSLTTDTWTSLARDNYMCVTVHFIDDDWKLQKRIIAFCLISSHKGEAIGRALDDCLSYWGLSSKLLTVTVDNASSNDVACNYLKNISKDNGCILKGNHLHMRCVAHIINLIVQDGIKECDDYVEKVRAAVKYVRGSPPRLAAFRLIADNLKIECKRSLITDVSTRWNSTYSMLSIALKYKSVFCRMDIPDLDGLGVLCAEDWDKVESLVCFLKEFYDLTHRVSASSYVTSNFMILHVLKTMKVFNRLLSNTNFALKHMARQMQTKCEKYWGSSDKMNMLMFLCAMLDPCYKMIGVQSIIRSICEQESCPESSPEILMKTVKDLAYSLFDEYKIRYSPLEDQETGSHLNAAAIDENDSSSWLEEINEEVESGMLDRDELSRSEFDQYLNESREKKKVDILHWWKLNGPRYPIVARMARDGASHSDFYCSI